jgi:hypothetical protein
MSLAPSRAASKQVEISFETLDKWPQGLYTRLDTDSTPLKGLASGQNVQLDQNGVIMPRPGLKIYGIQPVGTVMGQVYEFVKMNTLVTPNVPETWLIWMENRSGVGTVVVNKNGGTHTVVTGKTFSVTNSMPHFEQVYGNVLITTGVDTLSYMSIDTLTITTFTALTTPIGVSAVASGVSGSTYTLRYRVTAANLGETAASSAQTVTTSKLREVWNGTSEFTTFTWNRVAGATRYNIYVGDQAGFEYFLDTVSDSGVGTTQSYVDTGSLATTSTRIAPAGDSTAGPKTTRSTNIKGQIYMVGDSDNPGRIWFGGTGQSALDFSSYNGGGWVEPNKGGKDFPVIVKPFRDGKGTPTAVCFSKGTNGAGKRYLLQPATTTVGTTVITYMSVQEDNGQDGTDSPDGVVMLNDAAWYPSRSGFKTSNTKANIQNIISTQGISDNISTDVNNLSSQYMGTCVGLAYDQRIYWSLPYSSTSNNQIWVLDLRQKGAWMRPWNIAANWMWLYADNTDGRTKLLMLVNNQFVELDTNTATNDVGVAFPTSAATGEIKFGANNEWASVIDVTFEFLRPQGNINLAVNATTEDGLLPFTDTMTSASNATVGAWGRFGWGGSGWGGLLPSLVSTNASQSKRKWTIEIDEECQSINCSIGTLDAGVSYALSKIIIRYVPIGYKEIDNV